MGRWNEVPSEMQQILGHKITPLPAELYRVIFENKDFYGNRIYDPKGTPGAIATELTTYLFKTFSTPLSSSNIKRAERYGSPNPELSYIGITPANAAITRSPLQNALADYHRAHADTEARDPIKSDRSMGLRDLVDEVRKQPKDDRRDSLPVDLSKEEAAKALRDADLTPLQLSAKSMPTAELVPLVQRYATSSFDRST